jgi:hypothetical protein
MSTTSRNPTVKHSHPYNPNNNYFRPRNESRNFIPEELHNIENAEQAQHSPHSFEIGQMNGDDLPNDYQDNSNLSNHSEHTIHEETTNTKNQQISEPPYHYEQQIHASLFYQTT